MMIRFSPKTAMVFTLFIMLAGHAASGIFQVQTQAAPQPDNAASETKPPGGFSADVLKAMRADAENSTDLTEDVKKAILGMLDRAIAFKDIENKVQQEIANLKNQIKTAPDQIRAIEAELERPPQTPENIATAASNMDTHQRENRLITLEAELAEAESELNRLSEQLATLKNRPGQLQGQLGESKQRVSAVAGELKKTPPPGDSPELVRAQRAALLAEQSKLQAEIELYEIQLANHDAMTALLTATRDLTAQKVAQQESLVKGWQIEVQRLRELEAKKERVVAEEAKKLAVDMPPIVQKQYDIMIELGKKLETIAADEAKVIEKLEIKQTLLKELEENFALVREQVEYPMYSEAIGLALREQRRTLPSMENYQQESDRRRVQLGEIRGLLLDLDRQRRELANINEMIEQIVQSDLDLKGAEPELVKAEIRRLLGDRRDIVIKLETGAQRLFKNIQGLEFVEQQIASKAQEMARYLDEHLLWIRSAKNLGLQDLQNLPVTLKWLLNPGSWWQVSQHLILSVKRNPVGWILTLLIPITLICLVPWAHRDLVRVARLVYSVKTDSYLLTVRALALTLITSLGLPLLMGLVGWHMGRLSLSASFTESVGSGLVFAAQSLAGSIFLYELCRKEGLAKVHFKWPESVRRTIRRQLRWFIPILVTMEFLIYAIRTENNSIYSDSLGRLALISLMFSFFIIAAYVLRFSGEIASTLKHRRRDGWLVRMRFIWYSMALIIPLSLALLAAMGYYYSAANLYLRMGQTIALVLGLIIVKDLLLRWLFIVQRRLVYEDIKRKKQAAEEKQSMDETSTAVEGEAVVIEEPEVNLDQIYEKNQVLLRSIVFFSSLVGLWLIWNNVLPALSILEDVKLWSYTSEVEGVRTTIPVTLDELMLAIIVAIVTIVAAKNLPGLLEIILLNRFTMDYGARHAFTTIFSYLITALGVIITFSTIGIKWSNLQWLIAALSVGLGFGLQEIVANFICGLIVLFERPFRIGDTVTIADITGTVTRIQIRATTIMDWDRKELIVPNKEFITGRLVNWSLSDNIIRLKVPVGIAYGSDTELAEKLLLTAAKTNPLVIANPEPQAVFLGFGDNSLNFELRVFINGINDWIPMLHKLNQAVDREFRKANVSISFPQRDVHLDQIGPLEVRVVSD